MKWIAYCRACEKFPAHSGPNESAVLASAHEHAHKKRHSVAVGLCSCSGRRFIFTPLRTMRLARRPGALTYYSPAPEKTMSMCLFNDEEDEGNLWDNIVRAQQDGRY